MKKKSLGKQSKKLSEVCLMDRANCAAIIKVDGPFFSGDKLIYQDFNNIEWKEMDKDKIVMDIEQTKYTFKHFIFSKEYVDWFLKIVRAFEGKNKIQVEDLMFFYNKDAKESFPVLVVHNNIGMILAPRVDM